MKAREKPGEVSACNLTVVVGGGVGGEVGSLSGGDLRGVSGNSIHDGGDAGHGTNIGAESGVHGSNNTNGVVVGGSSGSGGGDVVGGEVGGLS